MGRKNGEPGEAVDKRKQEHIIRTAQAYIAQNALEGDFRFDVAEVLEEDGKTYFRYTENAFWLT
jgi:Holliday junction resolvase-like predicted endonuclease